MTRPSDLAERIARLERLLDAIEQERRGHAAAPSPADADGPTTRIRELTALIERRVASSHYDEADTIAMRALLDQLRSLTAELRAAAAGVKADLDALAARTSRHAADLNGLEDVR